jgi:hypothetical protein
MKLLARAWFALPLLVMAAAAGAAERLESGKWESAITTDGDTRTITYCVAPDEAASINGNSKTARDFAESKAKKAGAPCTFKSYEVKGDTVSYAMTCGTRTISDKTASHGQSSEGTKTIVKDGTTVTMLLKSKRIGACP